MDSLTLDIIFEMENMKCALMKFTEKVSHHKIWFLTNFNQMQLVSCPNKAFFTDLTFDLYFKMYFLTSDLNFNVRKTKSLCIKFTD